MLQGTQSRRAPRRAAESACPRHCPRQELALKMTGAGCPATCLSALRRTLEPTTLSIAASSNERLTVLRLHRSK